MLMRKLSYCLLACLLITSCATADDADFENLKQKRSYCVGLDIGKNFGDGQWDMDIEYLIQGLRDAYTGKEWKVEKDEMIRVISDYRKELDGNRRKENEKAAEENLRKGEAYLKENMTKEGITVLPSGLQYKIIKAGEGLSPAKTDTVEVNYRGTLIDGTEFDSSYSRGQTAKFQVDKVIPGWTEALQLMKEGAKWQVTIPANLAYGSSTAGPHIKPNSTLIFDIELIKVNP